MYPAFGATTRAPEASRAATSRSPALSRRRAEDKFSQLFSNDDSAQYKTAQKVLEGRYTWFEADILDPAGDGPHMPRHTESAAKKFERAPGVEAPAVGAQAEAVQ